MGDIVETGAVGRSRSAHRRRNAKRRSSAIDVLNGAEVVETLRCYRAEDLGPRVRLYWEGAEHKGRGRQTYWRGTARIEGAQIQRMEKINAWNPARDIALEGDTLRFDAITTGNFGGVDLALDQIAGATIAFETDHASDRAALAALGVEDHCFEAGGLERRLRLRRLPIRLEQRDLSQTVPLSLHDRGDNAVWVRVQTSDGHLAWSSPLYLCRNARNPA